MQPMYMDYVVDESAKNSERTRYSDPKRLQIANRIFQKIQTNKNLINIKVAFDSLS